MLRCRSLSELKTDLRTLLIQNDIADVPSGSSKGDKKGKGRGETVKASVTPQASSDMAQTSNTTQNNTAETKKGMHFLQYRKYISFKTDFIPCLTLVMVPDPALVPNINIDDLKQMKVGNPAAGLPLRSFSPILLVYTFTK